MSKTETIRAESIQSLKPMPRRCCGLGLTASDAIRLFYRQLALHKGLPFDVKLPNSGNAAGDGGTRRRHGCDLL